MRGREINCQMYSEILLISQFCLVLCLYVISWNCSLSQKLTGFHCACWRNTNPLCCLFQRNRL